MKVGSASLVCVACIVVICSRGLSNEARPSIPEMVYLQGGAYRTQADPAKEIPPRDYSIDGFWIGRYEVTFEQFDQFCEETGYYLKRYRGIDRPNRSCVYREMGADSSLRNYPAIRVCWLDATAYCLWLRDKTGLPFRLPTQVEWEFACTSAGQDPGPTDNLERDRVAWYVGNELPRISQSQIQPVGGKSPNSHGLHDMLGNVWEWCLDGPTRFDYPEIVREWEIVSPGLSPMDMDRGSPFLEAVSRVFQGPMGSAKALRGGAWCEPAERLCPSYRMFYRCNYCADRVGFRVLCPAAPNTPLLQPPAAKPAEP